MTPRRAVAPTPRRFARQVRRERLTGSSRVARERAWFRELAEAGSLEEAHRDFLRLKLYQAEHDRRSRFWSLVGKVGTVIGLVAGALAIYQWQVPDLTIIRVTGIQLQGIGSRPVSAGRIDGELSLDLWVNGKLVQHNGPAREAEIYGAPAAEVPFRWRGLDLRFRLLHYPPDGRSALEEYRGDAHHVGNRTTNTFPLTRVGPSPSPGFDPPSPAGALIHFSVESR